MIVFEIVKLGPVDLQDIGEWLKQPGTVYVGPDDPQIRCSGPCPQIDNGTRGLKRIIFDTKTMNQTIQKLSLTEILLLNKRELGYHIGLLTANDKTNFVRLLSEYAKQTFNLDVHVSEKEKTYTINTLYFSLNLNVGETPLSKSDVREFVEKYPGHQLFNIGRGSPFHVIAKMTTKEMLQNGDVDKFVMYESAKCGSEFQVSTDKLSKRWALAELLIATRADLRTMWKEKFIKFLQDKEILLPRHRHVMTMNIEAEDWNHIIQFSKVSVNIEVVSEPRLDVCESNTVVFETSRNDFIHQPRTHEFVYDEDAHYQMNVHRHAQGPHQPQRDGPAWPRRGIIRPEDREGNMHNQRPFLMRAIAIMESLELAKDENYQLCEYSDTVVGDEGREKGIVVTEAVCASCGITAPRIPYRDLMKMRDVQEDVPVITAPRKEEETEEVYRKRQTKDRDRRVDIRTKRLARLALERKYRVGLRPGPRHGGTVNPDQATAPIRICCREAALNPNFVYIQRLQPDVYVNAPLHDRPSDKVKIYRSEAMNDPELSERAPLTKKLWYFDGTGGRGVDDEYIPSIGEDPMATARPDFFPRNKLQTGVIDKQLHWMSELALNPPMSVNGWLTQTTPMKRYTQRNIPENN